MPVLYEIDPDLMLVYLAGFGHCTGAELVAADLQARNDPLRRPGMAVIADLQAISELDVDLRELRHAIERNRAPESQLFARESTAVLVRGSLDQLITETYSAMAEPVAPLTLTIVVTLAEAIAWLGLAHSAQAIEQIRGKLQRRYRRL